MSIDFICVDFIMVKMICRVNDWHYGVILVMI